jgi:hypothetical protein
MDALSELCKANKCFWAGTTQHVSRNIILHHIHVHKCYNMCALRLFLQILQYILQKLTMRTCSDDNRTQYRKKHHCMDITNLLHMSYIYSLWIAFTYQTIRLPTFETPHRQYFGTLQRCHLPVAGNSDDIDESLVLNDLFPVFIPRFRTCKSHIVYTLNISSFLLFFFGISFDVLFPCQDTFA